MTGYTFTKFTRNYPRGEAKISIQNAGAIRFSPELCRSEKIMDFKYVILFYDQIKNAIAFKCTNSKEEGAFRLTKDKSSVVISAKSFMVVNKLLLRSYAKRYDYKNVDIPDIGRVLVIELNTE